MSARDEAQRIEDSEEYPEYPLSLNERLGRIDRAH